jgi:hypothetical protein
MRNMAISHVLGFGYAVKSAFMWALWMKLNPKLQAPVYFEAKI